MVDIQKPVEDDYGPEEALEDSAMRDAIEPETGIVWPRFLLLAGLLALLVFLGGVNMLVFVMALVAALALHEAGHYAVARRSGMKVTEFFLGFGPRIFSFQRGETTYGLKVGVPLGAYVRIIGMNNLEDVDPEDEDRTYRAATWPRRVATILAGPATHFIVAFALMAFLIWQQGPPVLPDPDDESTQIRPEVDLTGPWTIDEVIPFSAAADAGLESGDRLLSVDGVDTAEFPALADVIDRTEGEVVELVYERDGRIQTADARIGERLTAVGSVGYSGLYVGDMVVSFAGQPVDNYTEFAELARDRVGERVTVGVVYGRELHNELITVNDVREADEAVRGFLGVSRRPDFPDPTFVYGEPRTFVEAISEAPGHVGSLIGDIASTAPRFFTAQGACSLSGLSWIGSCDPVAPPDQDILLAPDQIRPFEFEETRPISLIGATRIADQLANPYDVIVLLILLNLFFGLFNLVPLLPLDGGHIALATYERIRSIGGARYHADAAKLLPITYVIVMILMFVGGMAILRDIFDPI